MLTAAAPGAVSGLTRTSEAPGAAAIKPDAVSKRPRWIGSLRARALATNPDAVSDPPAVGRFKPHAQAFL